MAKDRTEQYLSSIAIELVRIRRILQGIMDLSCTETVKEENENTFTSRRPLQRAENIKAIYDAYDGKKAFSQMDPRLFCRCYCAVRCFLVLLY